MKRVQRVCSQPDHGTNWWDQTVVTWLCCAFLCPEGAIATLAAKAERRALTGALERASDGSPRLAACAQGDVKMVC